ncbi:rhamnose transport system substrate-binding protein [Nakamurella panacisegetis]|uniref:Rhamnose transport system substrate-binding protein n=1 Tax=Nakamurella panacisegetis TaxID=1090615 RepID=A0A1H0K2B8_9ACTN|nr:rhamnose ABC transporter substrate-binding protein [Nakamurella panacisegetis]SDO49892.1 rhamnose transport system substrate-binding protein [Nakamurella panacisegetis]
MTSSTKMRRLLGAATAVALATTMAACSSSSTSASSSSSSAAATSPAAASTPAAAGSSSAPAAGSSSAPAAGSSSAGSSSAAAGGAIKKGLKIYFIPKDTQNPYEVIADQGGTDALKELGGTVTVASGTQDTAAAQIPSIQAAIQAHADAIVIAANDPTAVCPTLAQAVAAGIKVVSFDSDNSCPDHLFINQANTEQIGTSEVDLLAKEINSTGEIAILSAAATATNQNAWIGYMKKQLTKYPNMKLVDTVYGDDDPAKSLTALQGLLSAHPNLKGIISPTTVGISTVAQYLSTHKDVAAKITLTGLGLPSQMKPYIKDGTVKAFELWNPSDLGYLAGYAAASLASGITTTATGAKFTAGKLGEYTVLAPSGDTGPSVVLGPPTVFDSSNIDKFNF